MKLKPTPGLKPGFGRSPFALHCGEKERVGKMGGKATRVGLYKCYACRKQFNVKVGTIFESSHVKMHIWLQAFYLVAGSKKGISSNQLHRTLGVTLKTAWFMGHRSFAKPCALAVLQFPASLSAAKARSSKLMKPTSARKPAQRRPARGYAHKRAVLSLVERGGEVRRFHIDNANAANIYPIIDKNLSFEIYPHDR